MPAYTHKALAALLGDFHSVSSAVALAFAQTCFAARFRGPTYARTVTRCQEHAHEIDSPKSSGVVVAHVVSDSYGSEVLARHAGPRRASRGCLGEFGMKPPAVACSAELSVGVSPLRSAGLAHGRPMMY